MMRLVGILFLPTDLSLAAGVGMEQCMLMSAVSFSFSGVDRPAKDGEATVPANRFATAPGKPVFVRVADLCVVFS